MTDDGGKCRGFGFVGFEDHESAQKVSGGCLGFCISVEAVLAAFVFQL